MSIKKIFFVIVLSSIQADMKSDRTPQALANSTMDWFYLRKKLERYLFMALKVAEQSLHISSCGMVAVRVTSLWDSVARSGTAFLKWDVCNFLKLTGRYLEWKKTRQAFANSALIVSVQKKCFKDISLTH